MTAKSASGDDLFLFAERLAALGFGPAARQALLMLEDEMFHFVRRVKKGDVPARLMQELDAGLEPVQFQALGAVIRIGSGHGRVAPEEATVGLLAEEMMVDPSRASRLAADLVERGLVARAVSQADGRRSVLQPTETGRALFAGFQRVKWQHTASLFRDWTEAEITAFAGLFRRYAEGMRQEYAPRPAGQAE
ncbi:MAG: MarR family transcriptional regulator [Rhodobacteraceae bacterium]|nr:MarR family transcriptional regulator [Paracoccaceae bacterium]